MVTSFHKENSEAKISERKTAAVFLLKKAQTPRTDPTLQGPLLMTSPLSFGVISIKNSRGAAQPLGSILTGTAV